MKHRAGHILAKPGRNPLIVVHVGEKIVCRDIFSDVDVINPVGYERVLTCDDLKWDYYGMELTPKDMTRIAQGIKQSA